MNYSIAFSRRPSGWYSTNRSAYMYMYTICNFVAYVHAQYTGKVENV